MSPLALLILIFTAFAVASAVVLCKVAFVKPRIGALVERAALAAVIAIFGVVCCVLVLNTDGSHNLLPQAVAIVVFRASLLVLLGIPTLWSYLYLTGRLGSPVCAVTTEAWGRCPNPGAMVYRVNGTGAEDLVLPLCPTHAAVLGATR